MQMSFEKSCNYINTLILVNFELLVGRSEGDTRRFKVINQFIGV